MVTKVPDFTTWLKRQSDRSDAIGDLARGVKHDGTWPRYTEPTLEKYHSYLVRQHGASEESLEALKAAWGEYRDKFTA